MLVMFLSFLSLFFKWRRMIFILVSFEFLVMCLFYYFSFFLIDMMFFYFMSFTVVTSILGLVMMVGGMKYYGSDMSVF